MAIRTIADDTIDPGHEQASAPRFPQLGVLEEARRRPGFPGSELAWAPDRSSLFALTTLWESTGACLAWQTQQLLPVPGRHPDVVGLGQPGTVDILEVEPGPASAHATSSNGQVAATPALTRGTAARRTAIKANLRGSRLRLLVRHADAGDKDRWQGPDSLRPLSLAGQAEAAGLVIRLEDYPIERILTSPTLRCHQTMEPLARDRRLRIEPEVTLGVDADLGRVLAWLADPRLQDTVVCTHGEVIGQVLTRLVADGLAVDQPLEWPKGSTWLLDGASGRLTHARYLQPLVLAPARSMASAPRGPVLAPDASSRPGV
jgi:broad specificity phosphatase PhoE